MLYTSGSTGKPKGVVIEHGALAHYIAWARRTYVVADPLSFPLFSPLTFDLTITSLFVPLTSGGTIVVYPETDARADLALIDVANDDQVDIIKLTPSHVRLLEQHDLTKSRARQLILGGEGLTAEMVRRIARIFGGDVLIHNEYGPTEATVGCVVHSFRAEEPQGDAVPIGRPIDNMRAWVLDARGSSRPRRRGRRALSSAAPGWPPATRTILSAPPSVSSRPPSIRQAASIEPATWPGATPPGCSSIAAATMCS